ncbi:MAG TPA: prealbumin-like fold domain-containing protein [Planctomycetota bacterium]|nr:prealbumin-like fold domain-containing protein [Planctomycetota bacterium]
MALGVTAGLSAQQIVTEVEPNDLPAQAQPITPGQQIVASFSTTTDEDWFSFTLTSPGQAHLRSINSGTLSLSLTRDTRIALYDASGTTRLAWNDGASGTRADCGVTLPAGSYLYRVGIKTAITSAVNYDLDFFVLPSRPIDVVESPEPNDPNVPGGVPTPMSLGNTIEGSLSAPTDVDFWSFTLPNPGIVQAVSFDDGGVPQLDNMALRFYQQVAPGAWTALGTGNATNSASHRVSNLQHPGILAAGTYAIAVQAGTAAAGTPPWDYVQTGRYSLRTCFIDMHGAAALPEAPEPNSDPATATFMVLGLDATGSAQAGNDPDWYSFTITAPTTVGAMAEGTGASPLPGSTLRIWDANGNTYGSASGNATTHGRLITTLIVPGTYYLEIAASQFAMTGDYILHTGECSPVYVQSSTRVEPASTNACIGSGGNRPLIGYLPGETPIFNSTFVTRIERTIPTSFAAVALGLSNTTALGGSLPLPALLDVGGLDPMGNPTPCMLRVDPVVLLLVLTDASGTGEFAWKFPFSAPNIGTKIYEQALCFDPTLNSLGLSVSNDASFVVGDLPF